MCEKNPVALSSSSSANTQIVEVWEEIHEASDAAEADEHTGKSHARER